MTLTIKRLQTFNVQIVRKKLPLEITDLSGGAYTVVISGQGVSDQLLLIKQ